ncbi:MAG: GGDEF domain-containing response regulator [Candidatus Eiseniibacteriota bacterium]
MVRGGAIVSQKVSRILVADDEPNLREALRLLFERNGFEVVTVEDGQAAVETAQREQPDVIVLDVMMPRMDGYEACRRLRAHFRTRHIPVVMLTAKGAEDDKLVGLEGGANDYVTKPWTGRELVQRIRNHLDWSKTQRAVSPLTGLPGNLSILSERQRRVDAGEGFAFIFLDLDNFKAFNDRYGFPVGDKAITAVAEVLVNVVESKGHEGDFLGHIGGDDFQVLTTPEDGEALAEAIKEGLDRRLPSLYEDEDRRQGFVRVLNRRHEYENFPLMCVTIAVAIYDPKSGTHLAQVDDALRELKEYGKSLPGSVVVTERRRSHPEGELLPRTKSSTGAPDARPQAPAPSAKAAAAAKAATNPGRKRSA